MANQVVESLHCSYWIGVLFIGCIYLITYSAAVLDIHNFGHLLLFLLCALCPPFSALPLHSNWCRPLCYFNAACWHFVILQPLLCNPANVYCRQQLFLFPPTAPIIGRIWLQVGDCLNWDPLLDLSMQRMCFHVHYRGNIIFYTLKGILLHCSQMRPLYCLPHAHQQWQRCMFSQVGVQLCTQKVRHHSKQTHRGTVFTLCAHDKPKAREEFRGSYRIHHTALILLTTPTPTCEHHWAIRVRDLGWISSGETGGHLAHGLGVVRLRTNVGDWSCAK